MDNRIKRRPFLAWLGLLGLSGAGSALAQSNSTTPLIALLIGSNPTISSARYFIAGLAEEGLQEGKDYRVEARYAEERPERVPELARELIALGPALIFADDLGSAIPAAKATKSVPIVCPMMGDPVRFGLAESLARPGKNVTGLSTNAPGLVGKQIEVAAGIAGDHKMLALLLDPDFQSSGPQRAEADAAAQKLGVTLVVEEIRQRDLGAAFDRIAERGARLLVIPASPLFVAERKALISLERKHGLGAVHWLRFFAEDGGLAAYGISAHDNFRRAASYAVRILRGAKPGDLPIEFPRKFELVLNLRAAKAIGLTFPPTILALADEVIE